MTPTAETSPPGATPLSIGQLARQAIEQGCTARAAGDQAAALFCFERAIRLVPDDPIAALLLGSAIGPQDPARADHILARALARHPSNRPLLMGWAAAALRRGDAAEASRRLHDLLSRGAPPGGPDFARLASRIASGSGAPGWVGLSSQGSLQIEGAGVVVRLDGRRLTRPAKGVGDGQSILPAGWRQSRSITAESSGVPLLGSPIDVASVLRVEGCITVCKDRVLSGWAWHPNDAERPVLLSLYATGEAVPRATTLADTILPAESPDDDEQRRAFAFDLAGAGLSLAQAVIRGPDGHSLAVSTMHIADETAAARLAASALALPGGEIDRWRPLPAVLAGGTVPGRHPGKARMVFDLILPLQGDRDALAACVQSARKAGLSILAVAADDPGSDLCRTIEDSGGVCLRAEAPGVPALLNAGLEHARRRQGATRGAILLATPCVLPAQIATRLAAALRTGDGAGLAQPLAMDVPPALAHVAWSEAAFRLDAAARRANAGRVEPLGTAYGPCLAIAPACLRDIGPLRDSAFAGAAAAFADLSWRARHLGWRSVLACDLYVAPPATGRPTALRRASDAQDRVRLDRLHPGASQDVAEDSGMEARRAVAMALWQESRSRHGSVILVTHAQGGGVERHIRERAAALQAGGQRAIVVRPGESAAGAPVWSVSDGPDETHPDLRFAAPEDVGALAACLHGDRPSAVELHHAASHPADICGLAPALGIPYDVVVHDFSMICPRVTLVGGAGRYCGEPVDPADCDDCIADHGVRIGKREPIALVRARAASLLAAARRVIVPSTDGARRLRRYFPAIAAAVVPWQDDAKVAASAPRQPRRAAGRGDLEPITVCVAGALGLDKGFDILLACARDAARRSLNLTFTVVGHTIDDSRLMDTGRVRITGRYEEEEAVALIRAQRADIGFLPSVWPETWCFALSALWEAGLWTLAFALGAQAERIAATGAGRTVPLGTPAGRLNDFFLGLFAVNGHG